MGPGDGERAVKREPQIFTRIDVQDVPVSDAVLDVLQQEELTESMVRAYIRQLLAEIRGGHLENEL